MEGHSVPPILFWVATHRGFLPKRFAQTRLNVPQSLGQHGVPGNGQAVVSLSSGDPVWDVRPKIAVQTVSTTNVNF
jgi:hypothetical protein